MAKATDCHCQSRKCPHHRPPGSAGTIFNDSSIECVRDISQFVDKYIGIYQSRVFMTRLMLRPTLVIGDNALVGEFLSNSSDDFSNGLKDQYSELFGHQIMFADALEAKNLRNVYFYF